MGCFASPQEKEYHARNSEIDKMLKKAELEDNRVIKVLLLGTGESGKSTVVKQMKLLYGSGYTEKELQDFRAQIFTYLLNNACYLITGLDKCGLALQPEAQEAAKMIQSKQVSPGNFTPGDFNNLNILWKDPNSEVAMGRSSEFYIMDNMKYFFDSLDRIKLSGYLPSSQDVLNTRVMTTGIHESNFLITRSQFRIIDVGGQRNERRKWIHCFEGVTNVLFCIAISEYDQVLLEDKTKNRIMESIELFENIINSRYFLLTAFILFLNKCDLFQLKVEKVQLNTVFPTMPFFTKDEWKPAATMVAQKFLEKNRMGLSVYVHVTVATDTNSIKRIFKNMIETILEGNLKKSGLM